MSSQPTYLNWLADETPTTWWHDSGDPEELTRALRRGASGATTNPVLAYRALRGRPDAWADVLLGLSAGQAKDERAEDLMRCVVTGAAEMLTPVYERTGGHAYGSVYPGPIGAVLSPQLTGVQDNASLPFASTLCGACYDACPVAIDIPTMLVHLRSRVVESKPSTTPEAAAMRSLSWAMSDATRWRRLLLASRGGRVAGRKGRIRMRLPFLSRWTSSRDLPVPKKQSFRDWWSGR